MEKAIAMNPFDKIEKRKLKKFDRVYIGSNFCQNLLPKIKKIEELYESGISKITLMTPLLTDSYLLKTMNLIENALKLKPELEVSANDLGVIDLIKGIKEIKILLARPVSHEFIRMNLNDLEGLIKDLNIKMIEK